MYYDSPSHRTPPNTGIAPTRPQRQAAAQLQRRRTIEALENRARLLRAPINAASALRRLAKGFQSLAAVKTLISKPN